jgi:hypothetical protein
MPFSFRQADNLPMPAGGSEHLAIGGWIRIIFDITVYSAKENLIFLNT